MSDSLWPCGLEYQASLSFTISWNLLKCLSIESVMLSNHLILCHPLHLSITSSVLGTRLSRPSLSLGVCSNSCLLSWWCYLTISSSATLFSSCHQSIPASGSLPVSQLFASGGQSIEASASILPMNIQGSFPLGWTGLISLLSKGLSTVFSNTIVQKHQFFSAQPSLLSNCHIHV